MANDKFFKPDNKISPNSFSEQRKVLNSVHQGFRGHEFDKYIEGLVPTGVDINWLESVLDFSIQAAGIQVVGNRYIASAAGVDWVKDRIYEWNGLAWDETIPSTDDAMFCQDIDVSGDQGLWVWNGTAWVQIGNITEAGISHLNISNIGVNTHAQIDIHVADATIHFTEANINHTAIQNIGVNTHVQIDNHIADGTIHFANLAGFNTDDLAEGLANLYFTNARAITALTGQNISIFVNDSAYITQGDIDWATNVPLNETDPVFTAWLGTPPDISIFTNDSGYITASTALWTRNAVSGYLYQTTLTDNIGFGINAPLARTHAYKDAGNPTALTITSLSEITAHYTADNAFGLTADFAQINNFIIDAGKTVTGSIRAYNLEGYRHNAADAGTLEKLGGVRVTVGNFNCAVTAQTNLALGYEVSGVSVKGNVKELYGYRYGWGGSNLGTVDEVAAYEINTMNAVVANNQKRFGLKVCGMPTPGAYTGTEIYAIELEGTNGERDGVRLGGDVIFYREQAQRLRLLGQLKITPVFTNNDASWHGLLVNPVNNITVDGSYRTHGLDVSPSAPIDAGITNTGQIIGVLYNAVRATAADAGTLNILGADFIRYGHDATVNATAITTSARGLWIKPDYCAGTITNAIDLLLDSPNIGGTVTNSTGVQVLSRAAITANDQTRYGIVVTANMPSAGAYTGTDVQAIDLRGTSGSVDGIRFGSDTNLYRKTENTLATDDRFTEQGTFAEIYVADGSTAQTIATGASYVKLTGFATDGQSSNMTSDVANDKITITKTGRYLVNCSMNGSSATPNVTFIFSAFLNGVEQSQVHAHRKYAAGGDNGSCSLSGIIDVTTASWDLDIRARHDDGSSVDFTPTYMNLTVSYLGET